MEESDSSGVTGTAYTGDAESEFRAFYREQCKIFLKLVFMDGARRDEAHLAVDQTMQDICLRWDRIPHPRAYGKRAVINNFRKSRQREVRGIELMILGGHVTPDSYEESTLDTQEGERWVSEQRALLAPATRAALAGLYDGFSAAELADLLGTSQSAMRKRIENARKRLKADFAVARPRIEDVP